MFRRDSSHRRWERLAGGILALAVSFGLVGGAFAATTNSVSTQVVGGSRTASIANLDLGTIDYSHNEQTKSGTMTLTADDSSGTNAGWNVTVQASDFDYAGEYGGVDIPSANLALTAAAAPVKTAGQGIGVNGPMVPSSSPVGSLDVARKVLQAQVNGGKGTYTQELSVSLLVPADSVAGTYTSTLTVTISAAP